MIDHLFNNTFDFRYFLQKVVFVYIIAGFVGRIGTIPCLIEKSLYCF